MDLSFLHELGVDPKKADDVIRRWLDDVMNCQAATDETQHNLHEQIVQLIQDLWTADAIQQDRVNNTASIIDSIVRTLEREQLLRSAPWSSIAHEAAKTFAKRGKRLDRRADRRNNGQAMEQPEMTNNLANTLTSTTSVVNDGLMQAPTNLDFAVSQSPRISDKMSALRIPQRDVTNVLEALNCMKPSWKCLMLQTTGAIRMRKGVLTPDEDPAVRLIVLPPPLDQQVAAAAFAIAEESTPGKTNGNGYTSTLASPSLPAELLALLKTRTAVFEPAIERPCFHQCPPADPTWAELGAVPLPAQEEITDNSSRSENKHEQIYGCGPLGPFRFIELFAGIGGFRVALEALGGQCVFASEVHPTARAVYRQNWPSKIDGGKHDVLAGDIRLVSADAVPEHDILTAGFPCQPFTGLGKQRGVHEPKGQLFLHICRILRTSRPPLALLENVTGLVNIDDGCALQEVLDEIRSSGYRVAHHVYDSCLLVPQKRKRVYIVAIRADLEDACEKFRFPWLPHLGRTLGEALERPVPSWEAERLVLAEEQWTRIKASQPFRDNPNKIIARLDLPANTLISCYGEGKSSSRFCRLSQVVPCCDNPQDRLAAVDCPQRYFSCRECARIQGFPEEFSYSACDGPYSWYRLIGNAVSPPVVCALAGALLCALRHPDQCWKMAGAAHAVRLALKSGTEEVRSRLLELEVEGPDVGSKVMLKVLLDSLEEERPE